MKFRKYLNLFLVGILFLTLIPPSNSVGAEALPPLPAMAKDDSLDSDFKMVSGEEYKANVGTPTGPGQRYTVKNIDTTLNFDDYMNDMNWMVKVEGYQIKQPKSQSIKGWMPLLRPLRDGSLGRLFLTDLNYWTLVFNGDTQYISQISKTFPTLIEENKTAKIIKKFYIRDLAKWSGATLTNIVGLGQYDTGLGNELAAVEVISTSFPDATITVPASTKVGTTIDIGFKGKEYYPSAEYGTKDNIRYSLKVNGVSIASGSRVAKSIDYTKAYTFAAEGNYKIELEVIDQVNRKYTATRNVSVGAVAPPPPDPEEKENIPPHAEVSVLPYYYWPEMVDISTVSYDEDGEIVNEEYFIDGEQIGGNNWSSSRVTEKTTHSVTFRNEDDDGATAEASSSFEILPTTPKAQYRLEGQLKQNRAVKLDAHASDLVSPVAFAPIDYSRTSWKITPKSEGLTAADIKIRPSSDPGIKQVLFKKPGIYELQLTVTNIYDETSEVLIDELQVRPDEKPFAGFTVDKSVYLRDITDAKQSTVTLTDKSASVDGDTIAQRIWYVEFDANNDGRFNFEDGGKQVISSANAQTVTYKTKHVGHYRFSLEVQEEFGEATYKEFILPDEYLKDASDVIDAGGSVDVYMKPENFNLPLYETAVKVDNVPPVIDFAVKRKNSIHVALDFGGMSVANLQHKTGTRAGSGINNGGGGGSFDHYYYNLDEDAQNKLTAYAGSLEADLRLKGLDAKVDVNNCYYRQMDIDGECVTNVPVWGNVDYGSYSYSSYSGTTPYSGSWEVTSSSSTPIMTNVAVWCYQRTWYPRPVSPTYPDGGFWVEQSHAPPCGSSANTEYELQQTGTRYTASLRKWNSDWRFTVTNYVNQGCGIDNRPGNPSSDIAGIDEKIDTTDFTSGFSNFAFNNAAYKYYFRMDAVPWTWTNDATKRNLVVNTIKNKNVLLWNNSNNSLRTPAQNLVNSSGKEGKFTEYNTSSLQANIQTLRDELLNKFMIEENSESFTIVLGDQLDYTTVYDDYEKDPELQREWKFVHDPTQVNNRIIDSQPASPIGQSGLYLSAPMQLNEVGTYTVTLRAKDNPLSDTGNDTRFADYRKWSDEEIVREYKINVHRRPIADFDVTVEAGTLKLTLNASDSFDPEHQYNWDDLGLPQNGIVEYTWEKYVLDGIEYLGQPPAILQAFKDYYITLRVKDIDGAYGFVTKLVSTKNVNLKPVALFDSPTIVLRSDSLITPGLNTYIRDRSYDPNGDPLTKYMWTIKRMSDGVVVWNGSTPPASFQSAGLADGRYLIGLRVSDIPKYPPELQSDLYEKEITVVTNNPPNSCFELSRTTITLASITCTDGITSPHTIYVDQPAIYTDKSSDPDGHSLINYSWTIEKLDAANNVVGTWNTGTPPVDFSVFGGIGKYRVTQIVFDNPPTPLRSLSGKHSRIFNVILGPQAPQAMFEYQSIVPIQGQTINLIDRSIDEDGTVVQWNWSIVAPNGTTTTQTVQNPVITNAQTGKYKVTLNVWDNTNLKSKIPAYKEIVVTAAPPNIPPVANIVWEPFKPFIGETLKLNPDASYDLDGTIVSYQWSIKSKEGSITNSSTRYPTLIATSQFYDARLTVRDDKGATGTVTQRINIDIARLVPLVTHTIKWKEYWTLEGYDADVNTFLAGEEFVIQLKTTPANRVEGSVNFGGEVGTVQIPSTSFQLVSTSTYEYVWEAVLWQENFDTIEKGQYAFTFTGYHPVNTPTVQSHGNYLITIVDDVYSILRYHEKY